ncbi:putative pilus system protein FilA [Acinetobacter bohemicus]|uniref:putative pilus system protein FilA n=1 Tax=Acinetobacter bohemicus TaxID=1435036 RepID=UPI003FA2AB70
MKKFTKLALVSSLAISANAMAMQAMDDASLGATTGQDGINIGIGISKIEIEKLYIHDNDGLTLKGTAAVAGTPPTPASADYNGGTSTAGAIVIKGNGKSVMVGGVETNVVKDKAIVIGANYDNAGAYLLASRNLADLQIDSDAGTGTNGAFINIAAQVSGLDINIGEIGVTASNAVPAAGAASIRRGGKDDAGAGQNYNAILSGLSLKTGQMTANIQLGAAPQGAMIKLNTKMVGGLEIKNLGILDNSTKQGTGDGTAGNRAAGEIFVESIKVADANSTDLTIKQSVSVVGKEGASNGYIRMISSSGPIDTYVKGVHLGSSTAGSIGDVEVQGMQTYFSPAMGTYVPGAVITISGR